MENIAEIVTATASACAALATMLPAPQGGTTFYAVLYRAIQFVGFNFGKAKNAQDK